MTALKSWMRLVDPGRDYSGHEALLTELVTGLEWYQRHEWKDREQDKIPHAATWLNQRRWEDIEHGTAEK